MNSVWHWYSGPCILRPPVSQQKYGLKLKLVLKLTHRQWREFILKVQAAVPLF